jgi:hypothetical protein
MDIPKAKPIPIINTINAINVESIKNYDYSKLKTPLIYATFFIILIVLMGVVINLIYSKSSSTIQTGIKNLTQDENNTAMMIISFMTAILLIIFLTIPNYKEILNFITRLKFVLLLVTYIIGLIILYRNIPRGIVDAYAFLLFPATLLIGVFIFYLAMEKGQLYGFDINYERVKYSIIYFCLIVFMLLFYTVDPGGYLKTYFGPSLILTILLAIFGFLYLITLMTLPTLSGPGVPGLVGTDSSTGGFFKGVSKMGLFSGVSFILFLILIVVGILSYPGGFTRDTDLFGSDKTNKVSGIVILLIIIFILWILFFGILSFSDVKLKNNSGDISNITKIARQVFMLLFGLTFSGLLIGWLVTGVEGLSNKSGVVSFVINLIVVVSVLALVFKLITGGVYYKKSPFFRLIVNTFLYIPCILVNVIEVVLNILGFGSSTIRKAGTEVGKSAISGFNSWMSKTIDETKNTPYTYYVILFIIILLYASYFFIGPQMQTNLAKQGGSILLNNPVYTNTENTIGLYDNLNGTDTENLYDYSYAISFWVFIDAISPNAKSSLNKYTSILNYGNKPNILYNASDNIIMITLANDGEPGFGSDSKLKNPQELDSNGNIIVYKMQNVLLQKWNNFIINYSNGTLDVFYNGELVKSVNEAVPKMSKDVLTIGSNNGVNGVICNVTYFNTSINSSQVYYLYNSVKNKNPPVANSSKESIVENVSKGSNLKYNPQILTIPINIDIKSKTPKSEVTPDQPVKSDTNNTITDYLSFKWFANANNDIFNGI